MNRGENDASAKPKLRASAEQLEQCYARQARFFRNAPLARNSRFALTSCFPRFCLAFASAPLKYIQKLRLFYRIKSY